MSSCRIVPINIKWFIVTYVSYLPICPPGLHITLGILTKMFNLLEAVCCNLDLELALHATNVDSIFQLRSIPMKNARYICILIKNFWHARLHNARMLVCEHFSKRERGYVRRPTVSRGQWRSGQGCRGGKCPPSGH